MTVLEASISPSRIYTKNVVEEEEFYPFTCHCFYEKDYIIFYFFEISIQYRSCPKTLLHYYNKKPSRNSLILKLHKVELVTYLRW